MDNNNDNELGEMASSGDNTSHQPNTQERPSRNNHLINLSDEEFAWEAVSSEVDWEESVCSSPDRVNSGEGEEPPVPSVLLKPQPKHKWSIVREVINRENGWNKMHELFPQRFYGSLHAVQRLELMYKLEEHSGCVNAINFNPSGTHLISGSDDRTVVVWDWMLGKSLSSFNSGHTSNVFQCKYLPLSGDTHVVTCSRDGQVRLATRNSSGAYESTTRLAQHTKACHKLTTLPHTPHICLSAGEDGCILSMDVREKKPASRLLCVKEMGNKVGLYSIHANPMTGNEICLAGDDYIIRLYDRRFIKKEGSNVIKFSPHTNDMKMIMYATCAVFNYNGSEVIGSYHDDDIYLFDTKCGDTSKYVHKYEGHRNSETVKGVNFFGPKSEFIVSGSDCGNIYFWDKHTEAIVQWMRGDEDGAINCLEPHPRIPVLATSGLDSDVKIWVPSCETQPKLVGLKKTVTMNHNRVLRAASARDSFNDTLMRWWRQMRHIERRQSQQRSRGSSAPPVIIDMTSLNFEVPSGSSSSSSSSNSGGGGSSPSLSSSLSSSTDDVDPMGPDYTDDIL